MPIYHEIATLLLIATAIGGLGLALRQPLIVSFIVVGIILGPAGMDWVNAHEPIELLSEMGITILLFVVGLKLDPQLVRHLGPVALATGLGQLSFTILFGYLLSLGLGLDPLTALYVAVALTFSSTIIIVKLLSDKREIDSLHGRIAMGFLIVQDIAVVIAMVVVGAFQGETGAGALPLVLAETLGKLAVALLGTWAMMRIVLPRLLPLLARSRELLLIFAVAWGTSLAALGDLFGFSKEVGALLAGFALAPSVFREAISSRLSSLRDFLLLFFFIHLGSMLDLGTLGAELAAAAVLALFVLIGNPLIVMAIMGYMGYRRRTGFLAGLTVAQISEFSIIFVGMGISLGHIGQEALGLVTLVGLITIMLSTYMILYSQRLYTLLSPWLGLFERNTPFRELAVEDRQQALVGTDVIIFGLGRFGRRLHDYLRKAGLTVVGVDFDPEVVRHCRADGVNVLFGDAEDPSYVEHLPLSEARYVVSTLPETDVNRQLLQALRHAGFDGIVAMAAHHDRDAEYLEESGVDWVLLPYRDASDYAARRIVRGLRRQADDDTTDTGRD